MSGFLVNFVFLIKSLNFSSPTFLAKTTEPTLEDLTRISSTDKSFGCSFISAISWMEHLIFFGISSIIVFVSTKLCSIAKATVKVLKIEPNSYTPFVILFVYFFSLISNLWLISKLGNETSESISPLLIFINSAPPPVALKILIALFNSLLIVYWILLSNVNCNGWSILFLFLNSLSKYFSIPETP